MAEFITALLIILFVFLVFIFIGIYLMSRLVGGFGNLRAIYRLFSGGGKGASHRGSAKTSASDHSSRTYNNNKGRQGRQGERRDGGRNGERDGGRGGDGREGGKMFSDNEGTYVEFEEVK